eukprot:2729618-Rhodomonas_salina.1
MPPRRRQTPRRPRHCAGCRDARNPNPRRPPYDFATTTTTEATVDSFGNATVPDGVQLRVVILCPSCHGVSAVGAAS